MIIIVVLFFFMYALSLPLNPTKNRVVIIVLRKPGAAAQGGSPYIICQSNMQCRAGALEQVFFSSGKQICSDPKWLKLQFGVSLNRSMFASRGLFWRGAPISLKAHTV